MMKDIHDIHDKGYKKLFSNKTMFRQLIETFVHEAWVRQVNFEQSETLDKSFIADHYKETESDLIYKVKLKGKDAYIVILLEFQSSVDRFMAVRLLNYVTSFYLDYIQSHKRTKMLPPIFPIVLYNAKKKWTAPTRIARMIQNNALLGRFAIGFEYYPIIEQQFPKDRLLTIRNLGSTLFLAETQYDITLLVEEFAYLFEQEEDRQAFWLLVNWFLQLAVHGHIRPEDYERVERMITTKEEVKTMLVEAIEQDRRKLYEHGRQEGKLEDARMMLAKGIAVSMIAEITGLPEKDILQLKHDKQAAAITSALNN